MIQKIQSTNSPAFQAKFWSYPYNITNPKFFKMFEERTQAYPNLILQQNGISFARKDSFNLYDGDKLISTAFYDYTSLAKKDLNDSVNKMVDIFNKMVKSAVKERSLN